jgi:hypothetical protein
MKSITNFNLSQIIKISIKQGYIYVAACLNTDATINKTLFHHGKDKIL